MNHADFYGGVGSLFGSPSQNDAAAFECNYIWQTILIEREQNEAV